MFLRERERSPGDFAGASVALMVFGVLVAVAGLLVLLWPGATVVTIAVILAIVLLLIGVFWLVSAIIAQEAGGSGRAIMALIGVLAIVAGLLCLRHPFETVTALVVLVGLFWVIGGTLEAVHAISTPDMSGRGWAITGGFIGLIAGIVLLSLPAVGAVVLAWLVGLELIVYGVISVARGVQVRRIEHGAARVAPAVPPAPA